MPGGGGTIEEISLVLSALQLGIIKNKKLILLNYDNYWIDIIKQYQKIVKDDFTYKTFNNLFIVCKNLNELKNIY